MATAIDQVRESAQRVVESGAIKVCTYCYTRGSSSDSQISDEAISTLLTAINPSTFTKLSNNHGYNLPLKYSSIEEELCIVGLLTALNYGSGYRSILHKHTKMGAFDNIKRFILALFLSKDSGFLTADGLANFTLDHTIELMNINPFNEHPHPTLPGVVVGEKDEMAFEFITLVMSTLNEIGSTLQQLGVDCFGSYLKHTFSKANDANDVVMELVTRFDCFRDEYVVSIDDKPITVKLYKKALLMVEVVNTVLKKHSLTLAPAKLPIFADNVIPSMLLHWNVIEIPENSEIFGAEVRHAFSHTTEKYEEMVDGLREEQKKDLLGEKVAGPALTPLQACILRSSAVEAIRRMSVRSTATEVEYDGFIWSVSKQGQYRSLVRFSEIRTVYY
ncbi:hypothetical protein E3P81_01689 [Wallemia ichthyophaga]|uniref:Queuosine 5'-phosphate N-glycosylase/hydrolase n=1 Tax=Wallemia ichthyophaga TaxID=245174 RepID=A0A4T0KLI1_WALIC|nr:hypothetical protein E3P97_01690 [Wallemia ichthyophaga]TIB33480.1 hypothetical protein E3P85_01342 [Wallemia ichthyophaga]TIB39723.1 hypothetical protein E3P86_00992 [Wallemia ichthyophaga]TIB47445.1 hypothetical protein E3P82_01688 [Wallemia ichthyophaga]TIB51816.1 hypothetical protein E3P81_01689 [Wallemia ichthyophaga]